jgi:hypothetical protein
VLAADADVVELPGAAEGDCADGPDPVKPDAGGSGPLARLGTTSPWPRQASSPCPASSFRSRTIGSAASSLLALGEVFGRQDLGSNAASPSAW